MALRTLFMLVALFFPVMIPRPLPATEIPLKTIPHAQLFSKFKKGEVVKGFVINGRDLMEIIRTTNYPIKISHSLIKPGLDFSVLPAEVENANQVLKGGVPSDASENAPEKTYGINNLIEITDSQISNIKMSQSQGLIFFNPLVFSKSTFVGETHFEGAVFKESVHFDSVIFRKKVVFSDANFEKLANFTQSRFKAESYFKGTAFHKKADFSFSSFMNLVDFNTAAFHLRLSLASADFKAYADFRETVIGQLDFDSTRRPVVISGRLDFRRSIISDAHFQDIFFENDIDFSDAIFIRVVFKDVSFEQNAYFLRTKFRFHTAFYNTRFKQLVDFTDADLRSNQAFLMSYIRFKRFTINWKQLPPLRLWQNNADKKIESFLDLERVAEQAGEKKEMRAKIGGIEGLTEVVSGLETAFRGNRQLKDANQAYREIKTLELEQAREGKTLWQWFIKQPTWVIWWATTGFGMRLAWITLWCLGINLVFTGLYFFGGRLSPSPQPDDAFKLRVLDFPKRYYIKKETEPPREGDHPVTRFFDLFIFSAVILMKVGYRGKVIEGQIAGLHYRWIVRLEWLLGLYLLPAWSYTLQNVVPVVNKLVTGIF